MFGLAINASGTHLNIIACLCEVKIMNAVWVLIISARCDCRAIRAIFSLLIHMRNNSFNLHPLNSHLYRFFYPSYYSKSFYFAWYLTRENWRWWRLIVGRIGNKCGVFEINKSGLFLIDKEIQVKISSKANLKY